MHPSDAADEIRQQNIFIWPHRLAELLSVIDGELWSPHDEDALRERLRGYMDTNGVPPASAPDEGYLERTRTG